MDSMVISEKKSPKLFGMGLGVGSIILIIILILGLAIGGYLVYTNLSNSSSIISDQNPPTPLLDTNDDIVPDINASPDDNGPQDNPNTPPVITPIESKGKLTITADNKSKTKGKKDPALTVTYSGFKSGDNPSILSGKLVIARTEGEKTGTYPITASGLTSTKYDINYVPGIFTIKSDSSGRSGPGPTPDPCENLGAVTFSPADVIYNSPIAVTLSYTHSNSNCNYNIRYTSDGNVPTLSSQIYSSAINLSTTTTIIAKVFSVSGDYSGTSTLKLYTFNYGTNTVDPPSAIPVSGTVDYNSTVALSTQTSGANIYYTSVPNTTPICSSPSTLYSSPIVIDSTKTIKAIACKSGMTSSAISTFNYTIQTVLDVNFSPLPQASNYNVSVSLSTNTTDSNIYYNINNSNNNPSCSAGPNSQLYGGPILIDSNKKIKAIACRQGFKPSQVITKDYNVLQVATPTLTPSGTSNYNRVITISSTPGATIRYTLNGSEPNSSSAVYPAGGITLNQTSTVTVKARAYKDNWISSTIASQTYPILQVSQPTAQPAGGSYNSTQTVTLTSTDSTSIKYTINNSTLTCSTANTYADPISISATSTLRAIGCKEYYLPSNIRTENYTINTQPPQSGWQWAKQISGTGLVEDALIANDQSGNVYVAVVFKDSVTIGTTTFNSGNNTFSDIFIAKYNSNGEFLWAKQIIGNYGDYVNAITTDSSGNAYLTGKFYSTVIHFDNVSLSHSGAIDRADMFVAKIDPNGNWLWAKKSTGSNDEFGEAIAIDSSNNVYVTGAIQGLAITFGNLPPITGFGDQDIFVTKLNSAGEYQWVSHAGGDKTETALGIVIDSSNNIYITGGYLSNLLNFVGNSNITLNNSHFGTFDTFIAKLDSQGNWQWAKQPTCNYLDSAVAITIKDNELYVAGYYSGTITFGSLPPLYNSGLNDIFVSKIDTSGNWVWSTKAGGTKADTPTKITSCGNNICVVGIVSGTASFGNISTTFNGVEDGFLANINTSGVWQSAETLGGTGDDRIQDGSNIFVSGYFNNTMSIANTTLTSSGDSDGFFAKKSLD